MNNATFIAIADAALSTADNTATGVDSLFDAISGYAVAGKAKEGAYATLRAQAIHSREAYPSDPERAALYFETECRAAETDFMVVNYSNEPKAIHDKNGKGYTKGDWKYRTYLPQGYNSAKSSLAAAIRADLDPAGVGKNELDAKRREKTSTPRKPADRIESALTTIINALAEMGELDAEAQRAYIADRLGMSL